jgi:hypothetical protein
MSQRDPIRVHQRKAAAARRVGAGAKCACGEARPEALIPGSVPIVCAECQRAQKGLSTTDDHHIAGKANSPLTVPISVNDHRAELSVAQHDWPTETLENPDGLDCRRVAAGIRGYLDFHEYLNNKLLRPLLEVLEKPVKCRTPKKKEKTSCHEKKIR